MKPLLYQHNYFAKWQKRDNWLNFEFFLATELGKTIKELRQLITQEELVYWAAYYENKSEQEKKMHERAKNR
jgi:hypothetical protein